MSDGWETMTIVPDKSESPLIVGLGISFNTSSYLFRGIVRVVQLVWVWGVNYAFQFIVMYAIARYLPDINP